VAQNVMRAMAALAIGRHQQAFVTQRETVNRVHIQRIHTRQPMLLRHAFGAVAVAAGLGNIQRIHRRARIRLGKNRVRVSMATRAGMLRRIRMNASCQSFRLIRVAALALHLRHLLRMRILLDVRVAIVALKASVNALAKGLPIHGDAVPVRILHGLVAMARQALRLRIEPAGREHQQQPANPATKIPLRMNIFARLANGSCKILRTPAALPILPSSFSGK